MPFDAAEVARQIEASRSGVAGQARAREDAVELALRIYATAGEAAWEQRVLVLSKEPQVQALMSEYFRTLRRFREIGVPVVGYISRPESQMVMRAIRMLACEKPEPCERRPDEPCACKPLWEIDDADLFW